MEKEFPIGTNVLATDLDNKLVHGFVINSYFNIYNDICYVVKFCDGENEAYSSEEIASMNQHFTDILIR